MEMSPDELKRAVESQHGGKATLLETVPIREMRGEQLAWEGTVSVFGMADSPRAKRAYAWSHELPDGSRRFVAVLHAPPIESPIEAVRASIMAENRASEVRNK